MSEQKAASPCLTLPITLHVKLEHQQHQGGSQDSSHEQVSTEETRDLLQPATYEWNCNLIAIYVTNTR